MSRLTPVAPVIALVYAEGTKVDAIMQATALRLARAGCMLAGFVQRDVPRPGRSRCDMVLEELASGTTLGISQDRGAFARGCRLDVGELIKGIDLVQDALHGEIDVLVLNKFGKAESEGGGFRPLIEQAVASGVPVLIAVPARNLDAWRAFAGDYVFEIDSPEHAIALEATCDALGVTSMPADAEHEPRNARHGRAGLFKPSE